MAGAGRMYFWDVDASSEELSVLNRELVGEDLLKRLSGLVLTAQR